MYDKGILDVKKEKVALEKKIFDFETKQKQYKSLLLLAGKENQLNFNNKTE